MDLDSITLPQTMLVVPQSKKSSPLGRRATTLLSGSPHGYSMSTCLNEAAWTLRILLERDRRVHASPPFGEGIALR